MEAVLFAAVPYVALSLAIAGGIHRYFTDRFSYSSFSSQFLESYRLFWASVPWHYGIIPILIAHLFGGLFPHFSASVLGEPTRLFALELTGISLGFLMVFGILFLLIRRMADSKLLAVTSLMDWILLAVLLAQVGTGIYIALFYRWGSRWYLDTAVPWFWSIAHFNPVYQAIIPLPWIVKFHMVNAFLIIALFPFTRLVHIFTVPVTYLWRPFQVVVWNRPQGG